MQLRCQAIPANANETPRCPDLARAPFSFCPEHTREFHALEERERVAARTSGRLKRLVDDMLAEGAEGYTEVRQAMKDERVARLYVESLEEQLGAAVALKTRLFSEAEERGSESLAVLEERKATVEGFLAELQAQAGDVLWDQDLAREPGASVVHSERPERVVVSKPATDADRDKPPAYPILEGPHPPCACTAGSSSSYRPGPRALPATCTAYGVRDGPRCTLRCVPGMRFCSAHCHVHETFVTLQKGRDATLEALRVKIVGGKDAYHARSGCISDIRSYIDKLEEMTADVKEHQRRFSCRSRPADSPSALLEDLKARRISAILLLAELSGRADAKVAEEQGQAETWANEYLAEVKRRDATESAEDRLTAAVVSGVSIYVGIPWARSLIAGVVTSFVVRTARDSAER